MTPTGNLEHYEVAESLVGTAAWQQEQAVLPLLLDTQLNEVAILDGHAHSSAARPAWLLEPPLESQSSPDMDLEGANYLPLLQQGVQLLLFPAPSTITMPRVSMR